MLLMVIFNYFMIVDNSLKMQPCADFFDMKMEQRFAVMNEELNSVCSKYAVGMISKYQSGKNGRKSSVYECIFDNTALYFECRINN